MALAATEGSEADAFTAFHRYFPGAPLLIDTYDTIAAAQLLSTKLQAGELNLAGVRIDSGDLATLSQQVRQLLPGVAIFASGDLDEYRIATLKSAGACIDGYGIGTQLVTGAPVNGVYKLVEIDSIPVMKESEGKVTYPGRKQIFRTIAGGQIQSDRLGLQHESSQPGEHPLLQHVMHQGERLSPVESLVAIGDRTAASVATLPLTTRQLDQPSPIPVHLSDSLTALIQKTQHHKGVMGNG
jgi:nicotinate phosphoribosyltransferase